jgi:hypothetical protein
MRTRALFFFAVVLVVVGVGVAIYRGSGPLPDPEGCKAVVAGHEVDLSTEQAENASLIAGIGVRRGLPARAVSIAFATAFQESKLRNLTSGDRDSIGLFQQRPSRGWGTPAQVGDPTYATNKFYDALVKVPNYETIRITDAAQKVQRSGFPEAYDAHAADARALASALTGFSPGGRFTCVVHASTTNGTAQAAIASLANAYGVTAKRTGSRQDLTVAVGSRQVGWSIAQYFVAQGSALKITKVSFDNKVWETGRSSEKGWQHDGSASSTTVHISLG